MVSENKKRGDIGEAIAAKFLMNKGFAVMERNYLKKWGEIDIVAKNKGIYHFVEVKTVKCRVSRESKHAYGSRETEDYRPEENVHPKKLERLYRTLESYLEEKYISRETEWQIDVITVRLDEDNKVAKVNFIENIVG